MRNAWVKNRTKSSLRTISIFICEFKQLMRFCVGSHSLEWNVDLTLRLCDGSEFECVLRKGLMLHERVVDL